MSGQPHTGDPLPWAFEVGRDCLNWDTGSLERWPWPTRPWYWQADIVRLLRECWTAWRVFSLPPEEWEKAHQDYFIWLFDEV